METLMLAHHWTPQDIRALDLLDFDWAVDAVSRDNEAVAAAFKGLTGKG